MQVAVSRAVTTCSVSRVCNRIPCGAVTARGNPTSMCPAVSAISCRRSFADGDADRRVGSPYPAPAADIATRLRRAGRGSRPAWHHHPGPTDSALGPAPIPRQWPSASCRWIGLPAGLDAGAKRRRGRQRGGGRAFHDIFRYRLGRTQADRRTRAAGDMRAEPDLYTKRGDQNSGMLHAASDRWLSAGI
jgi:hypothetical protein